MGNLSSSTNPFFYKNLNLNEEVFQDSKNINEFITNRAKYFKELKNIQKELTEKILSNNYSLSEIVSYCKNSNFMIRKLSSIFYFSITRNPKRSADFIDKCKIIISNVSELLEENNKDYILLSKFQNSSLDKKLLKNNISLRTKEAIALISKLGVRENFLLLKLYRGLESFAESFRNTNVNDNERKNIDNSIQKRLLLDKDEFLGSFDDISKIKLDFENKKNEVFNLYTDFIHECSKKHAVSLSSDEAFQVASLAFCNVLDRYNLSNMIKFNSYAENCIKFALSLAEIANSKSALNIQSEIKKVHSICENYIKKSGRLPNKKILAKILNITPEKANFLLKCYDVFNTSLNPDSLDRINFNSPSYLRPSDYEVNYIEKINKINDFIDMLIEHLPEEYKSYFGNASNEYLNFALSNIERNIKIFRSFYGIGAEKYTIEELSDRYGVSNQRISQIVQDVTTHFKNFIIKSHNEFQNEIDEILRYIDES